MADAEFHCERPFLIDGNELDGMTPQQVFVLGYELASIDAQIESGEKFTQLVHSDNINRIEWKLKKEGRVFRWVFHTDDVSESWVDIVVEGK